MPKADKESWTPRLLLLAFVILLGLAWWTALPFLPPILVAAFLVAVLHRPHRWLEVKLGGRRKTAAALSTLGVTLVLLVPLALFFWQLGQEIGPALDAVRDWLGPQGLAALPRRVPKLLEPLVTALVKPPGPPKAGAAQETMHKAVTSIAPVAGLFLVRAFDYLMMTFVLVLSLFYFFLDGRSFVAWVLWLLPLKNSYSRELLEEFWSVAYAMIWGTAFIAIGQGLCGSFIFWALGVPAPLLLALGMAFASFIPGVGTSLVWVPVGIVLALTGHGYKAGILFTFCMVVIVVIVDHLLRPLVVRGKMTMHPLVAFVAMFGGVIVFGLIGLLVGPLILSGLITVLRIYQRDLGPHADNDEADQPVPEQKPAGALPEVERLKH